MQKHPTTLDASHDRFVLVELERRQQSAKRTTTVLTRTATVLASIDEVVS